jgi:hypothetical protein
MNMVGVEGELKRKSLIELAVLCGKIAGNPSANRETAITRYAGRTNVWDRFSTRSEAEASARHPGREAEHDRGRWRWFQDPGLPEATT